MTGSSCPQLNIEDTPLQILFELDMVMEVDFTEEWKTLDEEDAVEPTADDSCFVL
jgi:hypothetical protein